jgi:hypothetical protein
VKTFKLASIILIAGVALAAAAAGCWPLLSICLALNVALWFLVTKEHNLGPLDDRQRRLIEMRTAGYTYREVGDAAGVSKQAARQATLLAAKAMGLAQPV